MMMAVGDQAHTHDLCQEVDGRETMGMARGGFMRDQYIGREVSKLMIDLREDGCLVVAQTTIDERCPLDRTGIRSIVVMCRRHSV